MAAGSTRTDPTDGRRLGSCPAARHRRGIGVATGYWLYLWQPGSKVEVAVKGGRLIASTATQDIGTGTRTVIANVVAQEFGIEPHEVEVRIGDSRLPEGPGSGGSRVTASVIPPMLLAIKQLKEAIQQNAKRQPVPGSNAPWREMLAASPDLAASGVRPEDSKQMAPGIRSPLKEVGLLGMIFGFVGLSQTKDGTRRGRGMAIAGLVIGVISLVACVAFWIYFAQNADCVRTGTNWECTTS